MLVSNLPNQIHSCSSEALYKIVHQFVLRSDIANQDSSG